ncbi:MAG: formylmethanofuran dehydrogenase subunit C [Candidatus Hodarchaeota archaeon]
MAEVKLKLKKQTIFPLEAESISPDHFAGKTINEIKKLIVYHGNEQSTIGAYFDVSGKSGDANELIIIIDGDLSNVKRIGEKMSGGEIVINGNVGMHVGNQMKGGKIVVNGDADDWAGAMLKGGELEINGDAGNYVGAAYRGFWKGMENGIIKVNGKVGHEAMLWARSSKGAKKFPMLICGEAGAFLGIHNHGGTIIIDGDVDRCAGADQAWGIIIIKGKVKRKLPSFKKIGEVKEIALPNDEVIRGKFVEYSGDHSVEKETNGRLFIAV